MEQAQVSKEEFVEWRDSKVTQFFISVLRNTKQDVLDALGEGRTVTPLMLQDTALLIGRAQALGNTITLIEEFVRDNYEH